MRNMFAVGVSCLAIQALTPAPAHAWWEFIEALSGPQLHGPFFEARVLCFMEERQDPAPEEGKQQEPEKRLRVQNFISGGVSTPCVSRVGDGKRRKASIDLGFRFLRDGDFEPANDDTVIFVSLEPAVSWSPINNSARDFFDLGMGGGMYWFSSAAFRSFRGAFFEPIRLDLHLTTAQRSVSRWRVLVPTGRVGVRVFPSGFDENAFAAAGKTTPRIGAEAPIYGAIFWDLETLYN